jgi:hypothetical protein
MIGRIKFQVWSPVQKKWRTAYVKRDKLAENIRLLNIYGFSVRWGR